MYEMKKEYYTGIQLIDSEHEHLFEIAENLYQLLHDDYLSDKYDHLLHAVNELKDYTYQHFSDEEAHMESISYEALPAQKAAHEAFRDKIEEVAFSDIDENQEQTITDLLTFLTDWLIEHILKMDKKIPA